MSGSGGVEGLYPFLYDGGGDVGPVLEEIRRSTVDKGEEIAALRHSVLVAEEARLLACARAMAEAFQGGGRLFSFGNGGSSTDAADVAHTFLDPASGRPLPAMSLVSDVAVLTALANDVGFEVVFARQLAAFAQRADIALGLSTSGGSANVLAAFAEARKRGLVTVGMAGYDGGKMAESGDVDFLFVVPSSSIHRIQETQTTLYHVLWELVQDALAQTGAHV